MSGPDPAGLARRPRQYRVRAGLSHRDLASGAGIQPHCVAELESCRLPPGHVEIVERLASTLGVPVDAFSLVLPSDRVGKRVRPFCAASCSTRRAETAPWLSPCSRAKAVTLSAQVRRLLASRTILPVERQFCYARAVARPPGPRLGVRQSRPRSGSASFACARGRAVRLLRGTSS